MASEDLVLRDGQFDWRRGMDSSLSPAVGDPTSVRLAVNCTFRGGRAKTRPGYQQIFLTDDPDFPGSLTLFSTGIDTNGNKTGNYFQGSFFYVNKTDPTKSCLIVCCGGYIFRIVPVSGFVSRLPVDGYATPFRWDATRRVYFCQAEKYLIVQNGKDSPLIWDGEGVFQVGKGTSGSLGRVASIPVGTFMAYGQGRLFVVNDKKDAFSAGDLVYGGSASQVGIYKSTGSGVSSGSTASGAVNTAKVVVTTVSEHGYSDGDVITIYGHSSTPSINGTWKVFDVGARTFSISTFAPSSHAPDEWSNTTYSVGDTFVNGTLGSSGYLNVYKVTAVSGTTPTWGTTPTVPTHTSVGTNGSYTTSYVGKYSSGFVVKANTGLESDVLRFTETTYLNEGGSFQIPSQMGQIRGLIFQPIADTNTGQGDLLVFGESGCASFAVAVPRDLWKNTPGFQRVALANIGLVSDRSLVVINNDIYFRAVDGIRSYRNARAQAEGYNVTPISTEMDAVLDFDTEGLLGEASSVYFDNRLLTSVGPRENYANILGEPIQLRPVSYQGIAALDFNFMGTAAEKRPAVWDGVWTGIDTLQIVTGIYNRLPRCFIFSYDVDSNSNTLWENYPWALFDFPLGVSARKIKAAVETRAFDFKTPYNLKKLERGDLWIGELAGDTMVNAYYRPDENPCWFPWTTFYTCSELETCITPIAATYVTPDIDVDSPVVGVSTWGWTGIVSGTSTPSPSNSTGVVGSPISAVNTSAGASLDAGSWARSGFNASSLSTSTQYFQWSVAASTGYSYRVKSIQDLRVKVDANGPNRAELRYSTDPAFPSNKTVSFGTATLSPGSGSYQVLDTFFNPNIDVNAILRSSSQTGYFRLYVASIGPTPSPTANVTLLAGMSLRGLVYQIESIQPRGNASKDVNGKNVFVSSTWRLDFTDPSDKFYLRLGSSEGGFPEKNTVVMDWATITADELWTRMKEAGFFGVSPNFIETTNNGRVVKYDNEITISFPSSSGKVEAPVAIPAKGSQPDAECGIYQPVNIKDQYRSQLRLPTPGNDCVTSAGLLARVGHNFQFRFEWEGQFSLTKIMFTATRMVEPVGGAGGTCS